MCAFLSVACLDSWKIDIIGQNQTEVKVGESFQINLQMESTNLD